MDFDKILDRRGTNCLKWDSARAVFGREDVLPMWVADTDFPAPDAVLQALERRLRHPVFGYSEQPEGVVEEFRGWLRRRHGFAPEASAVRVCESLINSMAVAINALTSEGDRIVTLTPVYTPFYRVIVNNRRTLVESPMLYDGTEWRMDFEGLEECFRSGARFMLLCNPQNPTGRVWLPEELRALAGLCLRYGVTVFSDDIHCDIVSPKRRYTPLALADERIRDQLLTGYSTSKTFNIAGIKGSYCIIENKEMRRKFDAWQERMLLGELSVFSLAAMEAAYAHGDAYCDALCDTVHENMLYVKGFADRCLPQIHTNVPDGTYLMLWDCTPLGPEGAALRQWFADRAGVGFSAGSDYGEAIRRFVRVNVACPRQTLERAMDQIRAAFDCPAR